MNRFQFRVTPLGADTRYFHTLNGASLYANMISDERLTDVWQRSGTYWEVVHESEWLTDPLSVVAV